MVTCAANNSNREMRVIGDVYSEVDEYGFDNGGSVGGDGVSVFRRVRGFQVDELEALGRREKALGAWEDKLVHITKLSGVSGFLVPSWGDRGIECFFRDVFDKFVFGSGEESVR